MEEVDAYPEYLQYEDNVSGSESKRQCTTSRDRKKRDKQRHIAADIIFPNPPEELTTSKLYTLIRSLSEHVKEAEVVVSSDGGLNQLELQRYGYARFMGPDNAAEFIRTYTEIEVIERDAKLTGFYQFAHEQQWTCAICGLLNYRDRKDCYQCRSLREFADKEKIQPTDGPNNGGQDQGNDPTTFIIVRGIKDTEVKNLLDVENIPLPKRIFLVYEKSSEEFCKFGFLEYNTTTEATNALENMKSSQNNALNSSSYINLGVFQPDYSGNENIFPQFLSASGIPMKYWNPKYYVFEIIVENGKEQTKNEDVSKVPLTQGLYGQKRTTKTKRSMISSQPHIQQWQNRQTELQHGNSNQDSKFKTFFADEKNLCCVLCFRQFESMYHLSEHEQLSPLHHENLNVPVKVEKAKKILMKMHGNNNKDNDHYVYT